MSRRRAWLAAISLFALAVGVRAVAAGMISFPATEDSAYYVDVARSLVTGHGLVINAIWSYATPPLVVPKPAFELWLPMATFISALPMAIVGATFSAAQWGSVVVGALIAPLSWLVGREAAGAAGLEPRRAATVAIGSGLVAAVLGPLVVATAVPDSTTPFLVFGVLAALLMPRALPDPRPDQRPGRFAPARFAPGVALGVVLGLAYLSRQEAVWLGIAYLVLLFEVVRRFEAGSRLRSAAGALGPVVLAGLVVVVPWLARNAAVFGSPFAGQALQNALLVRNEQIFAYADPPTLSGFLSQGLGSMAGNVGGAVSHDLLSVLVIPAFPVGLVGLLALIAMRRSPAVRRPTALRALILGGVVTLLVTDLLFPVATLWGTFLHASGPLLVGLSVLAVMGLDALVARVRSARSWPRSNAWLAPAILLAVAVPLLGLQVLVVERQASVQQSLLSTVSAQLRALGLLDARMPPVPIISDHPIWLSDALGTPVIALPDEPPPDLARLGHDFGASLVVVLDKRGRYPDALLSAPGASCLAGAPTPLGDAAHPAWLFRIAAQCQP